MDKATIRELNMQCRRALKKPLQFLYCPEGPDGEPVLVVNKIVKPQLTALKKTARRKKFVTGRLRKNGKALAFYPKQAPDKLARDIKNTFAKKVALLKTSTIVTPDQAAAQREADGKEPEETAKLAAKIGQRAAKFRRAPQRPSDKQLRQLRDQIKAYAQAGGTTDFSLLRQELSAEWKRRKAASPETAGSLIENIRDSFSAVQTRMDALMARMQPPDAALDAATLRDNLTQLKALREQLSAHHQTLLSA